MNKPLVSVVMPVYNREKYVGAAIESILAQTYTNFEFIIVDDGSTDHSVDIIQSYHDPRIRLIQLPQNLGVSQARNTGNALARGNYIAVMDSDDISLPSRFEKQLAFLSRHPDIGICGSALLIHGIEAAGPPYQWKVDANPAFCRASLACDIAFGHPTWMVRRALYDDFQYQSHQEPAADYGFMVQAAGHWGLSALEEPLVLMQDHQGRVSHRYMMIQLDKHRQICRQFLNRIGVIWNDHQMEAWLHLSICHRWPYATLPDYLSCIGKLIAELLTANQQSGYLDQDALRLMLARRWWTLCRYASEQGMAIFRLYRASPAKWQGWSRLVHEARMLSLCLGIGRDIRLG